MSKADVDKIFSEYGMRNITYDETLRQLYDLCVAALPEKDSMDNHDMWTSSITPKQVEAFNQAIDQSIEALREVFGQEKA